MNTHTKRTHPPALSPTVVELHTLIGAVLLELAGTVEVSVDLIDTRQAPTVGFLTPDAREARDKAVRADRTARLVSAKSGVEIPGETAAPLNIAAVSIANETRRYLIEVIDELHDELRRAGICWLGEALWHQGRYDRSSIEATGTYLTHLVQLVRRPNRLRPIHRHLEDLATRAKRVVDGEERHRLPEPCPHCRRRSLVVYTTRFVARCEHDPTTGHLEPCTCGDPTCPCHSTRTDYRHEWHRIGEHKHNSWNGLERAQTRARLNEENEMTAQAAIERIRTLHTEIPLLVWADDCTHEGHHHDENDNGDRLCWDCPPIRVVCDHCIDPDKESRPWPCPTLLAIDPPETDPTTQGAP